MRVQPSIFQKFYMSIYYSLWQCFLRSSPERSRRTIEESCFHVHAWSGLKSHFESTLNPTDEDPTDRWLGSLQLLSLSSTGKEKCCTVITASKLSPPVSEFLLSLSTRRPFILVFEISNFVSWLQGTKACSLKTGLTFPDQGQTMDGDMNYYQTSYHQGGGPSAAMKHPPAAPTDAYPRARTIPGGPIPSGAPLSHHQSYSSDTMSYGSRAPATGPQPLRKTMDSVGTSVPSGLPPSMLRDYSYERNNPYDGTRVYLLFGLF